MKIKNKGKINLIIDIIMFILMMMIAGIGFMIKYVLIPGYKRNTIYGTDADLYFWGLDRHQWGTIHLILGGLLLFLLFWHIVLHWTVITCLYKRMIPNKTKRKVLAYIFLFLSILFGIGPLLLRPEIDYNERNYRTTEKTPSINHNTNKNINKDEYQYQQINSKRTHQETIHQNPGPKFSQKTNQQHTYKYSDININGSMTMKEITSKYNLSLSNFANSMDIPVKYANERLGYLRKQYGFKISEIKEYIQKNTK